MLILDAPREMAVQKTAATQCQSKQSPILSHSDKRGWECWAFESQKIWFLPEIVQQQEWMMVLCLKIHIGCWLWFFTMDNAQVTILLMCVSRRCCCLFLAGWFGARDETRQEKSLHPGQAGYSAANFPSWIVWPSLWRSRFITGKGQIDCLHLTKIKASSHSLILCRTEFLRSHPISQAQPPFNSLNLWCPDPLQVLHSFCLTENGTKWKTEYIPGVITSPFPRPDQTPSLLLKCANRFYQFLMN